MAETKAKMLKRIMEIDMLEEAREKAERSRAEKSRRKR